MPFECSDGTGALVYGSGGGARTTWRLAAGSGAPAEMEGVASSLQVGLQLSATGGPAGCRAGSRVGQPMLCLSLGHTECTGSPRTSPLPLQLTGREVACSAGSFLTAPTDCDATGVSVGAKALWVFEQVSGSPGRFYIRTQASSWPLAACVLGCLPGRWTAAEARHACAESTPDPAPKHAGKRLCLEPLGARPQQPPSP